MPVEPVRSAVSIRASLFPNAVETHGPTRTADGGFWLLAALVQAWPGTASWTSNGLGWLFEVVADQPQPALLATPISAVGALAVSHPLSANTVFVGVMVALGIAFLSGDDHGWAMAISTVWLGFSWWMGQEFGSLFSGTATDLNTAVPLGLLTLMAAPCIRRGPSRVVPRSDASASP